MAKKQANKRKNKQGATIENTNTTAGVSNENVAMLIERGFFDPFRNRQTENAWTRGIKYIMNFLFACVQTLINIPILVASLYTGLKDVLSLPAINWKPELSIAWLLLGWYMVVILIKRMKISIISEDLNFIWALNFFGRVQNPAFSYQIAEEMRVDAEALMNEQSRKKVEQISAEYDEFKKQIETELKRVEQSMDFPKEFFDAIVRMVDLITNVVKNPNSARYQKNVLLDKLLSEVCSSSSLPGAHQATIMSPDKDGNLKIVGSVNIKESVVLHRSVAIGDGFVGKVFETPHGVWIDNLTDEADPQVATYNFEAKKPLPYKGIVGIPIKTTSETVGVISVHFREPLAFTEGEKNNIKKLLEVVGNFVVFVLTFDDCQKRKENAIMELSKMEWGGHDEVVAQQEVATTREEDDSQE